MRGKVSYCNRMAFSQLGQRNRTNELSMINLNKLSRTNFGRIIINFIELHHTAHKHSTLLNSTQHKAMQQSQLRIAMRFIRQEQNYKNDIGAS